MDGLLHRLPVHTVQVEALRLRRNRAEVEVDVLMDGIGVRIQNVLRRLLCGG